MNNCFLCCHKKNEAYDVEIYTLKSFQLITGKCQIDGATAILENVPVVANEDIIRYSKSAYRFTLSEKAVQKIKTFGPFVPFAVTVNQQVMYYGVFKPAISSSSCEHSITMDIDRAAQNSIVLKLGYPFSSSGVDDQRNHPKLMAALVAQQKLW